MHAGSCTWQEGGDFLPGTTNDFGGSSSIINDGRWNPHNKFAPNGGGSDLLTLRHNKRGDVNFTDGHVQSIRPQLVRDDPDYTLPSL